jgi:hypothetical protein
MTMTTGMGGLETMTMMMATEALTTEALTVKLTPARKIRI